MAQNDYLITPQSDIFLLKCPLEKDSFHQISFSNTTTQHNYFNSLPKIEMDNATYMRKDGRLYFDDDFDTCLPYNYCMYRNDGYSNKWFYAFVTDLRFESNNSCSCQLITDVYQTWIFDATIKQSFVERSHISTANDIIGAYTYPEGLETGEYVSNGYEYYDGLDDIYYMLQATQWSSGSNPPLATNFGGVIMAGGAYVTSSVSTLLSIIQAYANNGRSDAIYNLYTVPQIITATTTGETQYPGQLGPKSDTFTFTRPTTINGYTPKNNKLFTFPYCYILMSNNVGSSNILHYERFTDNLWQPTNVATFKIQGVPTVGCSIKCSPMYYDKMSINEENGIMAGKFPTLNWSEDAYTNWLTQNAVNIGTGIASSGLQIIGGISAIASGAGAGVGAMTIAHASLNIANQLGQIYEHSLQPNSAKGNVNAGDLTFSAHTNGFYFYKMSIKSEYAEIIDKYLTMFGYKINKVSSINTNSRSNWNFIKTIDVNITGDIPQDDMQKLKDLYNRGITIWHTTTHFLDYSQNNT